MNKAEFAVCRVKEKLPGNQGFLTKGSGCVVHCETLTTSWGWKCHNFIVTPSVVLCREDLSSDKTFVVEFLSKDKRGLETFEVKQMAEVCKDAIGRSMNGDFGRNNNLTFLSVEPLDKRGFLKKMVKKGSLQTFRPLDCLDSRSKFEEESLINEGLFCHAIADLFGESTNLPFSTQTFKLVYEAHTRQFSLQDFGGSPITFSHVKPPIGAVIFTKKGEFAGVVNFVEDCTVSPVFLPEPSSTENGQEERPRSCDGMNVSAVAIASDKEYSTECRQDPESDVVCDENSHSVKCSKDDMLHYNNNASVSSEGFLPHEELSIVKFQQDQGFTDNVISSAPCKTDELQTESILDSSNRTANNVKSNFEESLEEDKPNFPVTVEEASDKMEDAERSTSPSSDSRRLINSNAEVEQTALSSGGDITRDDDSLVTLIQVGEVKPVEMETAEQVDTSREEIAEQDRLVCSSGEIVSSDYEGSVATKEQADIREAVIECSSDDEDGQMVPTSKDDSGGDEMNLATNDSSLYIYTESEPVVSVGSIQEDKNNEKDSIEKPNAHVCTETSVENLHSGNATLVTLENNDLNDSSEGTFNTLLENSEVSIFVTPASEDDVNNSEEGDNLKDVSSFQEDIPEDFRQENSSVAASFSTDVTDEMIGEERRDSQLNVDNDTDLPGTESAQKSGVDVSLNLEQVDAEENTEVMSKDLNEHVEAELGECSPRFDGDQAVITHKEPSKPADEAFVSAEICENSDHNQNELDPAESPDLTEEAEADKCSTGDSLSSAVACLGKEVDGQDVRTILQPDANEIEGVDKEVCHSSIEDTPSNVVALEKGIDKQDIRTALEPASDVKQVDAVDEEVCGVSSLDDAIVLQRVDADSLLTDTITNNPPILRDLGKCLDTEYQHGRVPCWRDLAELLDIPPEAYEHCGTFSATSPTEDLFVFLAATKPQLTIQDIQEALREIDRHEVAQLLDRKITGGIISKESVVGSLVERDDTDILGRMALKLDRKSKNDWRGLALQLSVPQRVLRNFGSHQRHNSSLMLLKYIPIFDPELTVEQLKGCLVSIGRQDAVQVLENAGIPGDEPVRDILDDSDLLDQITDLLNEDPPAPHWRHLAKELKIPQEKCKIFEPTEDSNSPTKLLFKSIENWEPDLTFEELVLALVAMKRHDVLNVLQKYFSSDDVDQILEENNLLAPMEDHPDENES